MNFFLEVKAATIPVGSSQSGGIKITNPIKPDNLIELINWVLGIVIQIGTPILVLAVVYVGFMFVQARGNPGELNNAKQALMWTLIGAAIVLGAFVISSALATTVGNLKA